MLTENEEAETKRPDKPGTQSNTVVSSKTESVVSTDTQPAMEPEVDTDQELELDVKPAKKTKRARRKGAPTLNQVIAWFSACARCSYFLVGYRTIFNNEDLDEAVGDSRAGWLALRWDRAVCNLANKTYGSRFDLDCYHYDGICPECRRHFSFRGSDEAEGDSSFRIEIKPRTGR